VVALNQLIDVVGRLRWLRFVIDRGVFDFAPAELAALFLDVELETVLDRASQRGVGSGVRQHETNLDLAGLRPGQPCSPDGAKRTGSAKRLDQSTALPQLFVGCHGSPPRWRLRASSYTTHRRARSL